MIFLQFGLCSWQVFTVARRHLKQSNWTLVESFENIYFWHLQPVAFLIDFAFGIHELVPEQTSQVNMQTNKLRSRHNIGLLESLKTPQLACFRFDSCSFCSGSHFHAWWRFLSWVHGFPTGSESDCWRTSRWCSAGSDTSWFRSRFRSRRLSFSNEPDNAGLPVV